MKTSEKIKWILTEGEKSAEYRALIKDSVFERDSLLCYDNDWNDVTLFFERRDGDITGYIIKEDGTDITLSHKHIKIIEDWIEEIENEVEMDQPDDMTETHDFINANFYSGIY